MNDAVKKAQRRAKIAAIAKTGDYNPEEAAVAQAMLERSPEGRLESIAEAIKVEWGAGVEAQFAIGHLLAEAKALFANRKDADIAFGRWFRAQGFGFSTDTALRLRQAAENEAAVRAMLAAPSADGGGFYEPSVAGAVRRLLSPPKLPVADVGPTVPVDPAFAALRSARNLIVDEQAFLTMHVDDLAQSAGFIKELVAAYQEAKAAR